MNFALYDDMMRTLSMATEIIEQEELIRKLADDYDYEILNIRGQIYKIDLQEEELIAVPTSMEELREFFVEQKESQLVVAIDTVEQIESDLEILKKKL